MFSWYTPHFERFIFLVLFQFIWKKGFEDSRIQGFKGSSDYKRYNSDSCSQSIQLGEMTLTLAFLLSLSLDLFENMFL